LSLKFKNGSQIKAISSASTGARSEALSLLIVDEAAFIRNIEEIWVASQATLSTGGGCNSTYQPLMVLVIGFIKHGPALNQGIMALIQLRLTLGCTS
jgi:hypothetical protein